MSSRTRRLSLFVTIFVCSVIPLSVGSSVTNLLQPVALAPSSAGGLYALNKVGSVIYIPAGAGLDLRNSSTFATFAKSWQTVDMAAVHSGSEERVYVLLAQETIGMLMCYSTGRFLNSWIAKTLLTGIAPDTQGQRLFLSGGLTNQIYVFEWNNSRASPTTTFVAVQGAQLLGPLAFDSDKHVLYAGDERIGIIFAINTESKSVSQVTQIAGQISALAFDPDQRTLYVADSVGRKVWALSVDKNPAKLRVFSSSRDFRQPSAITVDPHGTIWLGDPESQAIYQLSPTGAITTYRLGL
jgi:DNA-binding beta-propeller fold protein YncE